MELQKEDYRVCSNCGKAFHEGWYLDNKTSVCSAYACSDECAMELLGVPTMEKFRRYRIYKEDIDEYLEDEGEGREEEDLTQDEIEAIIDHVSEDMQACYTEWY